jgi:hypothetical protein
MSRRRSRCSLGGLIFCSEASRLCLSVRPSIRNLCNTKNWLTESDEYIDFQNANWDVDVNTLMVVFSYVRHKFVYSMFWHKNIQKTLVHQNWRITSETLMTASRMTCYTAKGEVHSLALFTGTISVLRVAERNSQDMHALGVLGGRERSRERRKYLQNANSKQRRLRFWAEEYATNPNRRRRTLRGGIIMEF